MNDENATGNGSAAAAIRAGLEHPVIDSDGHWIEYGPHITRAMARIGGDAAVEGYLHFGRRITETVFLATADRRHRRVAQEAWWVLPTRNTRDRATAMMPALLSERLVELGIDFAVLYPTAGLGLPQVPDPERRRAACHAYNEYAAQFFADHGHRLTAAAVVPMYDPEEAVRELRHVQALGLRAVMLGSLMRRPIPALLERDPELAKDFPWLDVIGLDSEHDYDPVWACCEELGFSPTFHSNGRGRAFGLRNSPSSFVYNHIGHFAAASEAVCKALLLGGVTHRFPNLRFGFLEGGVGWACQLYSDVLGHWEKRRVEALDAIAPDSLDETALADYAARYAPASFAELLRARAEEVPRNRRTIAPGDGLDDFARCGVTRPEDLVRQFCGQFYFGCEADDPMNVWAFRRGDLPYGQRLKVLFGSDVGHFDVPDMAGVLPEAYEMVEGGRIGQDDFRAFLFANPVEFLSANRRDFFEGTAVESAVSAYWGEAR